MIFNTIKDVIGYRSNCLNCNCPKIIDIDFVSDYGHRDFESSSGTFSVKNDSHLSDNYNFHPTKINIETNEVISTSIYKNRHYNVSVVMRCNKCTKFNANQDYDFVDKSIFNSNLINLHGKIYIESLNLVIDYVKFDNLEKTYIIDYNLRYKTPIYSIIIKDSNTTLQIKDIDIGLQNIKSIQELKNKIEMTKVFQ